MNLEEMARRAGRAGVSWDRWTWAPAIQAAFMAWEGRMPVEEWEAAYREGLIERRLKRGDPVRWTTAPADYDMPGFGTIELEVAPWRDRVLRKVLLDPDHADYQEGRYGSGVHGVWAEDPREEERRTLEKLELARREREVRDALRQEGFAWLATLSDDDLADAIDNDVAQSKYSVTWSEARKVLVDRLAERERIAREQAYARCSALVPDGCILVDERAPRAPRVHFGVSVGSWCGRIPEKVPVGAPGGAMLGTLAEVAEAISRGAMHVVGTADVPPKPVLDRIGHEHYRLILKVPGYEVWVGGAAGARYEPLVLDAAGKIVRRKDIVRHALAEYTKRGGSR